MLDKSAYEYEIVRVIPYLVVLVGALAGINVFLILIAGTVLSAVVGVATGAFAFGELFQKMGEGSHQHVRYHRDLAIIVAAIVALVREYGGIQYILNVIRRGSTARKAASRNLSSGLSGGLRTANNTVDNRYGRSNRQRDQR